jgi:hypothetical protein
LDLIGYQQGSILAAQFQSARQVTFVRDVHTMTLDGFDDEAAACRLARVLSSAARSLNGTMAQCGRKGPNPSRKYGLPFKDRAP